MHRAHQIRIKRHRARFKTLEHLIKHRRQRGTNDPDLRAFTPSSTAQRIDELADRFRLQLVTGAIDHQPSGRFRDLLDDRQPVLTQRPSRLDQIDNQIRQPERGREFHSTPTNL